METHEIRAASDSAAALFGMARESLRGRSIADLLPAGVPGDDPAGVVEASLARPGRPQLALELHFRSVSYDGRACWITSAREVTAERANRAASEQSALRALAFDRSPVATCVADAEGRLLQANAAFCALMGLETDAVAEANLRQFEVEAEADATVRSVAVGSAQPDVRECRWQRADGSLLEAEVSSSALEGAPGLRAVTVRDLSLQRRALQRARREQQCQAALLDLVQQAHSMTEAEILEQALVASGEFAGGALGYVFLALPEAGHLELAAARGGDSAAATDFAPDETWMPVKAFLEKPVKPQDIGQTAYVRHIGIFHSLQNSLPGGREIIHVAAGEPAEITGRVEGHELSVQFEGYEPDPVVPVRSDAAAYPAGRHEIVWDGRTAEGSPASSGVYFCRLKTGRAAVDRKLVLLR